MVKKLTIEAKKINIKPDKINIKPDKVVDLIKKPKLAFKGKQIIKPSKLQQAKRERINTEEDLRLAGKGQVVDQLGANLKDFPDTRNDLERVLGLRQNQSAVFDFFELLDRPDNATRSAFNAFTKGQNAAIAFWEGLTGEQYIEHSDWLNIDKKKVKTRIAVDIAITFALSVLVAYISGGSLTAAATTYGATRIAKLAGKASKIAKVYDDYSRLTINLSKGIFKASKTGFKIIGDSPVIKTLVKFAPDQARQIKNLTKHSKNLFNGISAKFKTVENFQELRADIKVATNDIKLRFTAVDEALEWTSQVALPTHHNSEATEYLWKLIDKKGIDSQGYKQIKKLLGENKIEQAKVLSRRYVEASQFRLSEYRKWKRAISLSEKKAKGKKHIVAYHTGFDGVEELLKTRNKNYKVIKKGKAWFQYGYTTSLKDFQESGFYKFLLSNVKKDNINLTQSSKGFVIVQLTSEGRKSLYDLIDKYSGIVDSIAVKNSAGFIEIKKPRNMSDIQFESVKNRLQRFGITKTFERKVLVDKQIKNFEKFLAASNGVDNLESLSQVKNQKFKNFLPQEIEAYKTFGGANDLVLSLNDEAMTRFYNVLKKNDLKPGVFKDSVETYIRQTINPSILDELPDTRALRSTRGEAVVSIENQVQQRKINAPLSSDVNKVLGESRYGEAPLRTITDTLNIQLKGIDFIKAVDSIGGKMKLSKLIGGGHEEVIGSFFVTNNKINKASQFKKLSGKNTFATFQEFSDSPLRAQYVNIDIRKFEKALEENSKIANSPLTKAIAKDIKFADSFYVHKSIANSISHVFDIDKTSKVVNDIMDNINNIFMKDWKGLTLLGAGIHAQNVVTNSMRMYSTLGINLFNPTFWINLRKNSSQLYKFKKLITFATDNSDFQKQMLVLSRKFKGANLLKAQKKALKASLVEQWKTYSPGKTWKSPKELVDYLDKFDEWQNQGLFGRTIVSQDAMESTNQVVKAFKNGVKKGEYNPSFLPKPIRSLVDANFKLYGFVDEIYKVTAYEQILNNKGVYDQLLNKTWNQGIINDKKIVGEAMRRKISSRSVKTALFDFSEISDFERTNLRKYVTFFTWGFKNSQLLFTNLINNPMKLKKIARFITSYREQVANVGQGRNSLMMPSWLLKRNAVPLPWLSDEDRDFYLNVQLPSQSAEDFIRSFGINSLHPALKSTIQLATGVDLFKKSKFDFRKDITGGFAGTLTSPITRKAKAGRDLLNNIFKGDGKGALDTIFGSKIKTVDKEKRKIYIEKMHKKQLDEEKKKFLKEKNFPGTWEEYTGPT